ncbi:alpha/beta hydrolase family protein [Nocardioides humilatus]|nr:alpha/beta fold hydrolase [Nocardioides humilatus]
MRTRLALMLAALVLPGLGVVRAVADEPTATDVDTFVTSFDGTRLQVHLMRTSVRAADGTAPVIAIAHGFGEAGPSDPDGARLAGAPTIRPVLDAGYDVLTWDARGHGGSEGNAMFDSPDYEVKDVQAILDWLAAQPGVQLDAPGDPRIGMVGASYGGIVQFLVAALDDRVDVIAPGYTSHDLARDSLSTNGKFKEGWGLGLAGMGGVGLIPAGLASPLGPQLHLIDPPAITGLLASVVRGTTTPAFTTYLDHRSPARYLRRITVPTLIQGGTSDTLFPLDSLVRDYSTLKARGVPVKLVWNCEGHSLCPGSDGPLEDHFNDVVIRWMDRWLKADASVDTGPQFEWLADNEDTYRSAVAYPPASDGALRGAGSGQLPLLATGPLSSVGFIFIGAQPAAALVVEVPIAAPSGPADVVGFPRLQLSYRGRAVPGKSWVYAQVLDARTHRVVGVQVTPVPVVLDGRPHRVSINLNAIATRADATSDYRLQIIAGSMIFGLQRSTGVVTFDDVRISLPVIDPARAR